ncbi:hypothetical protein [Microbacterium panaciterrae]|uniref:Uncharacterized protein n=1 Tax=Microbacterium panaciterrae TaxID=985759 RepID=A0ABP8PSZ8_9MICO
MGSQTQRHEEDGFGQDLIEQMEDHAKVLHVFDEGQDIALDLHEKLLSEETRQRALAFLQSPRYASAIEKYERLTTGPVDVPEAGA